MEAEHLPRMCKAWVLSPAPWERGRGRGERLKLKPGAVACAVIAPEPEAGDWSLRTAWATR